MFKFENSLNHAKKVTKKVLKIGSVGLGLGFGLAMTGEKAEAQNHLVSDNLNDKENISIETSKNIENKKIKPEDYDLKKISHLNLIDLEAKKSLNPEIIQRIMQESLQKTNLYDQEIKLCHDIDEVDKSLYLVINEIKKLKENNQEIPSELSQKESFLNEKYNESLNKLKEFRDITVVKIFENYNSDYLKSAPDLFKNIELAREEIKRLISSDDYINKLQIQFNCSHEEALRHQQVRLSNIDILNYEIKSIREIKSSAGVDAGGYAIKDSNIVVLPYDLKERKNIDIKKIAFHEFLHLVDNCGSGLSSDVIELLNKNMVNNSTQDEFQKQQYEYHSNPTERYVRLKALESDLEKLNVLKIGEEFTYEKYKEMIRLSHENKLSNDAEDFIMYTKHYGDEEGYKILKELFSKIALSNDSKQQTTDDYVHPGWNYGDQINQV